MRLEIKTSGTINLIRLNPTKREGSGERIPVPELGEGWAAGVPPDRELSRCSVNRAKREKTRNGFQKTERKDVRQTKRHGGNAKGVGGFFWGLHTRSEVIDSKARTEHSMSVNMYQGDIVPKRCRLRGRENAIQSLRRITRNGPSFDNIQQTQRYIILRRHRN